ncbi:glycine betaine/proline transport system ATP-binding protein [Saccharicrinis carchari]|uniref:Glycine betaine/proline transport system ATP-binding protein n=1 Tax=Saccharicrinis carchari TaxID=1168039 RepID=A0A521AWY1_SACCC|nr:glycine betaine/L-proline ABC transporter ATP-binding protein [Saccharicrinis carchari]SMO39319.1 glycine betaine/proline transport system ATP-binding protein [Saccharicrinis carchari]
MSNKITIENLSLIFGKNKARATKMIEEGKSKSEILSKTGCNVAVRNANLSIAQGEIYVVMGLSGSGKSTLLRCINRLIEPTMGKVFVDDKEITKMDSKELLNARRKELAMVFQHFGLLPHRSVMSNVAFGLELQGQPKEQREKHARDTIEMVGLKGYEDLKVSELSGGMQQRVGLARGLANDPKVLLMDEAFSALDPLIRAQMQDELLLLQETMKKTIVFITHDLEEAIKLGDKIAIMKDGEVVQIGTPEEIVTNPADDYVKSFVENVDRTKITTASSIMFSKPKLARLKKDGPSLVLKTMRENGTNILPVVRTNRTFLGFIHIEDVLKLKNEGAKSIETAVKETVMCVSPDTLIQDMLPLLSKTNHAIPVVDESNYLMGVVSLTSLIAETTGKDKGEINSIIQKAIEL